MRLLAAALLAAAAGSEAVPGTWEIQARYAMGTVWTVEARGERPAGPIDAAFAEIRRLDALLSTYRPDSELSRINREAARDWAPVSAETRGLLARALGYARESGGAFDPTVGAVVRLWGFKHLDYRVPADADINAARARTGFARVRLDPARGVRFDAAGLELDLGAIAKGYAVDRALDGLRRAGMQAARVDAGGNQGVFGKDRAGKAWLFGIKHPRLEGELLGVLALERGAVSTSGDAERGFWKDGVRYGHIVDPLEGRPVRGMLSVTVAAPTAEEADALSTALYVVGAGRGKRVLASHPGSHALWVLADATPDSYRLERSEGFQWQPCPPPAPWSECSGSDFAVPGLKARRIPAESPPTSPG